MANLPPYRIYWHASAPLFTARVNAPGTILYPVQDIGYDGVTIGSYTNLAADMLVTFGSAEGLDDLGRTRLRAAPTSTVLKIGRASQGTEDGQVDIVDNAWVHVYPDYRVHSKIPVIGGDYNEYKDSDLAVGDLTQMPPPVAIMGPDRARRIDTTTGLARLFFDGSNSYAVADGATIVSYAWDSQGGTFVLGTGPTDAQVYIDFTPGVRYVSLTVTDSNGKTHSTRRLVLADDPANSLCVSGMQVTNLTRTDKGLSARLRVLQDLPRADYPDGAHVLIFEDRDPAIFGTPDPTDWSTLLFSGWHQVDEASSTAQETHLRRETQLTCVDVLGRLDSLPGFNQRVEVPTAEDLAEDGWNWGYMPAANMDKFQHYLIHWHSTAASVADFFPSGTWTNYPFVLFDAVGDTLYNQLQRQAARIVPDHNFTSDRYGRMKVVVNPQYQDPADRTSTIHNSVTAQGWSAIEFGYNRNPRVHTLRGSAILTGTDYILDGEGNKTVETAFSVAPGTAPGQGGREQKLGERLAQSQAALNSVTGHHYAHLNARYGDITLTLTSNADPWDFDPASFTWVQLLAPPQVAPQRGLDFESIRCLCKEVSIDYVYGEEATTWRARVVLERETVGLPALTEEQQPALPPGEQPPPIIPPDFGLITGQELVAAVAEDGKLYRTFDFQTPASSGGPTWAEIDLATGATRFYSWVVDPFSPGYINQDGTGAINGWVVSEADIYRVADVFGVTPTATSVHTFAVALGTSSVPAQEWRTIQASFGAFFPTGNPWLMVVSHYRDATGHTGTWATYSVDGGASFGSEVQITPHYDAGTGTTARPMALYLSPKTPGHALAVAYSATADPAPARGYVTTGWGASWTALPIVDTGVRLGGDYHVPWLASGDATIYHGKMAGGVVTDPALMPMMAYFSTTNVVTLLGLSETASMEVQAYDDTPSAGETNTQENRLVIAPPPTTKRMEVTLEWSSNRERTGASSSVALTMTPTKNAAITQTTGGTAFNPSPAYGTTLLGTQTLSYVFAGGDWPTNNVSIVSSPPTMTSQLGAWYRSQVIANAFGVGNFAEGTIIITATVTEIELDDGTTYVPISDNTRSFSLRRVNPDTSVEDLSPVSGAVNFGPNSPHFRIRAHDSAANYLVAALTGNDVSASAADDTQAIFVSDDAGATWTQIVAPVTSTQPFAAAFAGDTEQTIYLWAGNVTIAYSSDFGATIDSRVGNLGTFTPASLLGIAGGPIGGA